MLVLFAAIATAAEKNELPVEWHGHWTGNLVLPKGDPVAMEIRIEPVKDTARFTWQITYGEGNTANVRKYELEPEERVGSFKLDEKNGIVLDMTLRGSVMHSQFTLDDTLLAARYELRDGKLHYEITSSAKPRLTGGKDGVPEVKVHPITTVQTVVLSKKK
jgi:hypothetical protein